MAINISSVTFRQTIVSLGVSDLILKLEDLIGFKEGINDHVVNHLAFFISVNIFEEIEPGIIDIKNILVGLKVIKDMVSYDSGFHD